MTCKKAQGFLGPTFAAAKETVDATKVRYGADEVLKVLDGVDSLLVARGKKIERVDLAADRPDDATLLGHLLGPTGNLRAPTARVGATLVVGFNEDAYRQALGTA